MDHCQVINALGGYRVLSRTLRVDAAAVWRWQKRGIPSARWLPLVDLAKERGVEGVTLEVLARGQPAPPAPEGA
jgi:hypothetical protein